ncbi:MAG TPA: RNA polymerase sigma factor [Terriglobia bacterium]|nr:RNA polymerase sigma factor [Terriglobia bacterium]
MEDQHQEYERFIAPIEKEMMQAVWRITGNRSDAEDAFQAALMKIWKQWGSIGRHPNPRALVLRLCANAAYDVWRGSTRRQKCEEPGIILESAADPTISVIEQLVRQQQQSQVMLAIGHLSRKQGQAILMHTIEELSYGEIAVALNCSEATVRKHIARARARLRKLLAPTVPSITMEVTHL